MKGKITAVNSLTSSIESTDLELHMNTDYGYYLCPPKGVTSDHKGAWYHRSTNQTILLFVEPFVVKGSNVLTGFDFLRYIRCLFVTCN